MNILIKPNKAFTKKYLTKAVRLLGRKTVLANLYQQEAESRNLLNSREALVQMMTGLVKIRRGGWISDSEYIRLQEYLVDRVRACIG